MPPKAAPKEKVAKGDEAEEMVAQYLKSVNRPYASTDVSANLKNKVPKAGAQKVMLTLAEKGVLTKKEYGKQVIFVYNQELLEALSADEVEALDKTTKKTHAVLEERRKALRSLQTALTDMESAPKTKELSKAIEQAKSNTTMKALLPYRGEGGTRAIKPLDAKEIKVIDDDFTKWRKEWEARRKVYRELIGQLGEGGMIADIKELQEEQSITVDDEEAIAVEQGEFCKPAPTFRRGPAVIKNGGNIKRAPSAASDADDGGKKKKVKKA